MPSSRIPWLSLLLLGLPSAAHASSTVAYPFEDGRWLAQGQTSGGAAYVSDGARGSVPLVVFLHGVNESKRLHPRISDGEDDLRKVIGGLVSSGKAAPMVLAGPTQSRDANYTEVMFFGFDLDAFVDATQQALPGDVHIDRSRVVVVGHSGGACNPSGGLLGVAKKHSSIVPMALVVSDACMDSYVADALKAAPDPTRILVYWQTWMWPRRFDMFRQLMAPRGNAQLEEITGLMDVNAHGHVAELALGRALPLLLPP